MPTMILFSVCFGPTTVGGWKWGKPRQRRVGRLGACWSRWSPRGARGRECQGRRIQRRRTRTTDENIRNRQQGSGQFGPRLDTGKLWNLAFIEKPHPQIRVMILYKLHTMWFFVTPWHFKKMEFLAIFNRNKLLFHTFWSRITLRKFWFIIK